MVRIHVGQPSLKINSLYLADGLFSNRSPESYVYQARLGDSLRLGEEAEIYQIRVLSPAPGGEYVVAGLWERTLGARSRKRCT
jgi:hypothetical protein